MTSQQRNRTLLIAAIGAPLLLVALPFTFCAGAGSDASIPSAPVKRGNVRITLSETGELRAEHQATIQATNDKMIVWLAPEGPLETFPPTFTILNDSQVDIFTWPIVPHGQVDITAFDANGSDTFQITINENDPPVIDLVGSDPDFIFNVIGLDVTMGGEAGEQGRHNEDHQFITPHRTAQGAQPVFVLMDGGEGMAERRAHDQGQQQIAGHREQ